MLYIIFANPLDNSYHSTQQNELLGRLRLDNLFLYTRHMQPWNHIFFSREVVEEADFNMVTDNRDCTDAYDQLWQ